MRIYLDEYLDGPTTRTRCSDDEVKCSSCLEKSTGLDAETANDSIIYSSNIPAGVEAEVQVQVQVSTGSNKPTSSAGKDEDGSDQFSMDSADEYEFLKLEEQNSRPAARLQQQDQHFATSMTKLKEIAEDIGRGCSICWLFGDDGQDRSAFEHEVYFCREQSYQVLRGKILEFRKLITGVSKFFIYSFYYLSLYSFGFFLFFLFCLFILLLLLLLLDANKKNFRG